MVDRLETDRLLLRPFKITDAPAAFGWLGDDRVMHHTPAGADSSLERKSTLIQSYIEHQTEYGFSKWLVLERASQRPIGDCGLLKLRDSGKIDLGFRLMPSEWGKGFATEMASAWVRAAFGEFAIRQLTAIAHPENDASRNVLEKAGFRFVERAPIFGMDALNFVLDESDFARVYGA